MTDVNNGGDQACERDVGTCEDDAEPQRSKHSHSTEVSKKKKTYPLQFELNE